MAQQTAVEWLVNELETEAITDYTFAPAHKVITLDVYMFNKLFDQAKQMEKEQQIDFAKHCLNKAKDLDILTSFMNAEQYYNETYKNK